MKLESINRYNVRDLYGSMPPRNITYKAASQPEKPVKNLSSKLSQANNNPFWVELFLILNS